MKITHTNGDGCDTNTLPDVDAMLMEKSKELHELFSTYNRQLLLVGEMKAADGKSSESGCAFFHVAKVGTPQEEIAKGYGKFWWRANGFILGMTEGNLCVAPNIKPE